MGAPRRPNDDLHALVERYERLHQALKRDVQKLVPAHLRHFWLPMSFWTGTGNPLKSFFEEPSQNRGRRFSLMNHTRPDINPQL